LYSGAVQRGEAAVAWYHWLPMSACESRSLTRGAIVEVSRWLTLRVRRFWTRLLTLRSTRVGIVWVDRTQLRTVSRLSRSWQAEPLTRPCALDARHMTSSAELRSKSTALWRRTPACCCTEATVVPIEFRNFGKPALRLIRNIVKKKRPQMLLSSQRLHRIHRCRTSRRHAAGSKR
jgi:hypothetical protein